MRDSCQKLDIVFIFSKEILTVIIINDFYNIDGMSWIIFLYIQKQFCKGFRLLLVLLIIKTYFLVFTKGLNLEIFQYSYFCIVTKP